MQYLPDIICHHHHEIFIVVIERRIKKHLHGDTVLNMKRHSSKRWWYDFITDNNDWTIYLRWLHQKISSSISFAVSLTWIVLVATLKSSASLLHHQFWRISKQISSTTFFAGDSGCFLVYHSQNFQDFRFERRNFNLSILFSFAALRFLLILFFNLSLPISPLNPFPLASEPSVTVGNALKVDESPIAFSSLLL